MLYSGTHVQSKHLFSLIFFGHFHVFTLTNKLEKRHGKAL